MIVDEDMGILEIQVVATRSHLLCTDAPCNISFHSTDSLIPSPPVCTSLQIINTNWLGHRIGHLASWNAMLVVPNFLCRSSLFKEKQISSDAGIRLKDAIGEANDGMQVTLPHQMLLQASLHTFTKENSIWQHNCSTTISFQQTNDQRQEQICSFFGSKLLGEVGFNAILHARTKRRIGQNDICTIHIGIAQIWASKGIFMTNKTSIRHSMQKHISDA